MASSTVPVSCIQIESAVLPADIDTCWKSFRALKFDDLAPEYVTSTEIVSGHEGCTLGSVIKIAYKDGGIWQTRITEISDRNFSKSNKQQGRNWESNLSNSHSYAVLLQQQSAATSKRTMYYSSEGPFHSHGTHTIVPILSCHHDTLGVAGL